MPKVLGNLDLNKNQIQNAILQPLSTAPSNPKEGQIYYNSTDKNLYRYNGTSWVTYQSPLQIETVTEISIDTLVTSNSSNLITSGAVSTAIGDILPTVTASDNGKVLKVVSGKWNKAEEQIDDTLTIQGVPADAKAVGDALIDKAPVIIDKSMTVEIEPVQDLHGYDNPWAGGVGKNKLNPLVAYTNIGYNKAVGSVLSPTISSNVWQDNGNGTFSIANLGDWAQACLISEPLPLGKVSLKITNVTGSLRASVYVCKSDYTVNRVSANYNPVSSGGSISVNTTFVDDDCYLIVYIGGSGTSASIENPYIGIGDTASSDAYSPYKNLCPITGWTGATVYGSGKNLWGGQPFADAVLASCTSAATQSGNVVTLPNGANNVQSSVANRAKMFENQFQDGSYTIIIGQSDTEATLSNKSMISGFYTDGTYTSITAGHYDATNKLWRWVSNSAKRIAFLRMNRDEAVRQEYDLTRMGIFQGNVSIEQFEPYNGAIYPITWESAGTVYGGTLTINEDGSADLVVTDANIASYSGEALPGEWISDRDVYSAGATPTTGAQVVYKLATPITYHLTAEEMTTLPGANNWWADTGDVSIVENRCDTKVYIDNKINTVYTAINNITGLPSQTGNSGKFLTTNGTTASWVSLPVYDGTVV